LGDAVEMSPESAARQQGFRRIYHPGPGGMGIGPRHANAESVADSHCGLDSGLYDLPVRNTLAHHLAQCRPDLIDGSADIFQTDLDALDRRRAELLRAGRLGSGAGRGGREVFVGLFESLRRKSDVGRFDMDGSRETDRLVFTEVLGLIPILLILLILLLLLLLLFVFLRHLLILFLIVVPVRILRQ
jgi:hypothetical protein